MSRAFERTEMLLGHEGMERLKASKVVIFGVGGVGSYAAEALARSGVGHIVLVDHDVITETNINRQIHAGFATLGQYKTFVMQARIQDINPACKVETHQAFVVQNADEYIGGGADFIIDAVDTVTAKLNIIETAYGEGIAAISAMGAANRLQPDKLAITDIYKTGVCPLAKVMRKELKKRGIPRLAVCYSMEEPVKPYPGVIPSDGTKRAPLGSVSFVPSAAGLMIAGHCVRALAAEKPSTAMEGDFS